jgi:hypothetical protein
MPSASILIAIVILFVVATVPVWPYSRAWGFWPSGILALALTVVVGLLVMG